MEKIIYPNPRILDCLHYSHKMITGEARMHRIVNDYEIDINITGERLMWVNGSEYHIVPGSVVCRRPGETVEALGNFDMYALTLDFSKSNNDSPYKKIDRNKSVNRQPDNDSYYWETIPTYFVPKHSMELIKLYEKLNNIWNNPLKIEETNRILASLLHLLLSDAFLIDYEDGENDSPLNKVISYMNIHYNEMITLDDLASVAALNKSYLVRLFKQKMKATPIDYLNDIRLSIAKNLLLNSAAPLKSVCEQCGFETSSYFIFRFQKKYGITPGEYRKNYSGI